MRKDVAEDHLSFIESIGLYWINPASGADQGPWISHHSDDQTGHMLEPQGAQKLHDGAAAHSLEKAGGTSTTVSSGCLDKVMSSSEEMMMTMANNSQNHETGQIEELDFLSMLGLTKVGGGGGEAGSTSSGVSPRQRPQPRALSSRRRSSPLRRCRLTTRALATAFRALRIPWHSGGATACPAALPAPAWRPS